MNDQDYQDALLVLRCMGITRKVCPSCHRRTATSGYVCWNCGHDDSDDSTKQPQPARKD